METGLEKTKSGEGEGREEKEGDRVGEGRKEERETETIWGAIIGEQLHSPCRNNF